MRSGGLYNSTNSINPAVLAQGLYSSQPFAPTVMQPTMAPTVTYMQPQQQTYVAAPPPAVKKMPTEDWESSKFKAELSYRTEENNDLKKKIAELDTRATQMGMEAGRAQILERENATLRQSIEEERRLAAMRIEDKERQQNGASQELTRLQYQLQELQTRLGPIQAEVQALRKQLEDRDSVIEQQQNKIASLMGDEYKKSQSETDLKAKLAQAQTDAAQTQKDNDRLLTLLNDQRERNTTLMKEIHPLQNENLELRARLRRLEMVQVADTPRVAGVGMLLGKSAGAGQPSNIYVLKLVPGGPADQCAQIEVDDVLYAVDGVSVQNSDLNEVFGRIRGPEGSAVTLELGRRGREGEARYRLTLTRRATGPETPTAAAQTFNGPPTLPAAPSFPVQYSPPAQVYAAPPQGSMPYLPPNASPGVVYSTPAQQPALQPAMPQPVTQSVTL